MRKIGIGLLVIVVLLLGAAFLAPKLIDWNGYKSDIAAAVRDATGRELAIDGDIEISILPSATFSVSGVRFANAEGMEPADMAKIARVEGEIGLLALIGGGVDVKRLVVTEPEITLAIDAEGRPNWAFQGVGDGGQSQPAEASDGDGPIGDVTIGDLRIENGRIAYSDARTGQAIEAKGVQARAALPSLADPLSADIAATVNEKAVMLTAGVDTPKALLDGGKAAVNLKLDAPDITMAFDGQAQQKPAPGLDGTFSLDIPSAGKLAAWLDRPLPEGQPDPGPVMARAVFEADGDVVAIREATLEGDALDAQIVGRLDVSGDAPALALDIKSGVLDIDRYLPPPTDKPVVKAEPRQKTRKNADPLAGLSSELFDLTPLRQGKADVSIAIDGVKAAGLEVGAIRFVAKLADGVLNAELAELQLYDGGVTGAFKADASGDVLDVATNMKVAGVDAGKLGAAATAGPSPVQGRVSADLTAAGTGASPKALAENLAGKLAIDLGGLDLGDAAAGAVSGLKVNLDLPGVRQSPTVDGVVVYNKERVEFQAKIDPLPQALAGERFQAEASISSKPLSMSYSGAILKAPVPGLDGAFKLNAPSVGRLAAWAGQPLPKGQPDPGPLGIEAVFAGAGEKVDVEKAQIRGDGLNIDAEGSWAKKGDVTAIALKARAGVIDLDRYLPASAPAPAEQAKPQAGGGPLSGLSDAPLDLSVLRAYAADVDLAFQGLKASGQSIGESALRLKLEDGVLTANLAKLGLAGGNVAGAATLDASGDTPSYTLNLDGSALNLKAMQPDISGTAGLKVKANGAGRSPRALVAGTSAEIAFTGQNLTIPGEPPRKLPSASLNADIRGVDGPLKANGEAMFEGEPVKITLETDPIAKITAGERFALKFDLSSAPIAASYNGAITQKPAPGLDGKLSFVTPSVGKALAWIGQPLPKGQPDPGPLSVAATLQGDGAVTRLESASIDGKAFKARASGSLDATGARPVIQARIDVDQANIDAYLPPQQGKPAASPAAGKGGWSTEPIDLSGLSAADGDAVVNLKNVTYSGLLIESGRIDANLKGGVLNATLTDIRTASGAINGQATLDGSRATPRIAYKATAAGVNIRPILKAFADSDRLSGRTELSIEGSAKGAHQKALVSTLNGKGSLQFFDGAIHGMNVAQTLREAGSLGLKSGAEKKTDFAEMGGTFTITNGIVKNDDFKMLAPLLRASGLGPIDLPKRSLGYNVEAKLVDSLSGQGGKDALAGIPIPIKVRGTFDNPKFDIDWKAVLQSAALDPSRLQDLPKGLLGKADGLGVKLPGLGKVGGGGSGGAKPADAIKGLLGGGGSKAPAAPKDAAPKPAPKPADAVKKLKGLFGN